MSISLQCHCHLDSDSLGFRSVQENPEMQTCQKKKMTFRLSFACYSCSARQVNCLIIIMPILIQGLWIPQTTKLDVLKFWYSRSFKPFKATMFYTGKDFSPIGTFFFQSNVFQAIKNLYRPNSLFQAINLKDCVFQAINLRIIISCALHGEIS